MTDAMETLIRRAGEIPMPEFDLMGLRARGERRRRRRRLRRRGLAVALVVVVLGGGVALVSARVGGGAREVSTAGPAGVWHWTRGDGVPGAAEVVKVVHGATGLVAIGPLIQTNQRDQVGIWHSLDGVSWQLVYTEPSNLPGATSSISGFVNAVATAHGYVVTGFTTSTSRGGSITKATVWTSSDGIAWQRVDDPAFEDGPPGIPPRGGPVSAIYDVTVRDGQLLAVGERYTASRAPDGGQPCIWTSPDGTHWTHTTADLGTGFDPILNAVATRGGLVVVAGRIGRYPAVVWTSQDLRHWTPTTVTPQGSIRKLVATTHGFIAAGGISPNKTPTLGGSPVIWSSPDGHHWTQTLRLPKAQITDFRGLVVHGDNVLAVGARDTEIRKGTNAFVARGFAYVSRGGHNWTKTDRPPTFPAASVYTSAGTTQDSFIITGEAIATNQNGVPTSAVWTGTP